MQAARIGPDTLRYFAPAATTTIEDARITIQAPANVDWWRNPDPVKVNRRDGPFAYLEIDGSRSFECEVWLRSELAALYDQACVVLHGGNFADEWAHWLKTGTETFDERQWINAVVATPFCDVSTVLSDAEMSGAKGGEWVYIRLTKERNITGHVVLIRWMKAAAPITHRRVEESELANLREVQAFGVQDDGSRSGDMAWKIGVMVSGLMNPIGATGEFEGFGFRYLDESK